MFFAFLPQTFFFFGTAFKALYAGRQNSSTRRRFQTGSFAVSLYFSVVSGSSVSLRTNRQVFSPLSRILLLRRSAALPDVHARVPRRLIRNLPVNDHPEHILITFLLQLILCACLQHRVHTAVSRAFRFRLWPVDKAIVRTHVSTSLFLTPTLKLPTRE